MTKPPRTLSLDRHRIPRQLTEYDHWVCWRWKLVTDKQGRTKWTKVPVNPHTGELADTTNPGTWAPFSVACFYLDRNPNRVDGIGFVFSEDDPFFGIDIDNARDPETGRLDDEATALIDRFDTFTEWSITGTGAHIIGIGSVPDGGNRRGRYEVYDRGRFFVMSGNIIANPELIGDRSGELALWHAELFPPKPKPADRPLMTPILTVADDELLTRCMGNEKFRRLWDGNDGDYADDTSRADLAFCNIVVRNGGDHAQVDALYRRSGRAREKWDSPRGASTYGKMTIAEAFDGTVVPFAPVTLTVGGRAYGAGPGPNPQDAEMVVEVWPDLQPLPPATPVPTLPADLLPEPLRPWIADVADVNRIPVEMVAMPAIVALGSIVGRSVGLRPWDYNDHVVVPNLWGLVVTRPGWMKTSAVGEALKPVGRLAALERESYEERRDIAAAEIAALEAVLEDVKRRMREAAKKGETLDTLKEQFAEKTRELRELKVTERRYITHDATIEKLAELLIENPRGMLVARDEVYGLLRSFEKSGHENDRQFYLEGWSGTGSFTTDRIGRGTLHIPAVTLSIIGGIQPGRLRNMIDEAASGGGGDDGLLQRFQLTVWPDRLEPWQKPTRWPDGSARERAFTIFKAIDELRPLGLSPKSDGDVPYLTFTPFAQRIADDWRDELEHRLRSDEFDNAPAFASHLAKYRSLMPSLALLFHLVDIAGGTTKPGPINEGPTRLAAAWCEFLEVHARKLYDVEVDRGKRAAQALAAKIKAGNIVNEETVRDIYRNQWSGLKTDEIVTDGLAVLESLGWVRLESIATAGRARQIVRLHPDLRKDGNK